MTRHAAAVPIRQTLLSLLALGAVHQMAPYPALQAVFHAFLVIGLAPEFRSSLVGALWAAAAGWVLEGSLRMYPHMGGTALANMIITLTMAWTLGQWPPRERKAFWARLAAFVVVHILLVHGLVRFASGAHAWGTGPLWTLLLLPLWGSLAFKLYVPRYPE